jgi:hypothetical protein
MIRILQIQIHAANPTTHGDRVRGVRLCIDGHTGVGSGTEQQKSNGLLRKRPMLRRDCQSPLFPEREGSNVSR